MIKNIYKLIRYLIHYAYGRINHLKWADEWKQLEAKERAHRRNGEPIVPSKSDPILMFCVFTLIGIGIVMVYSSSVVRAGSIDPALSTRFLDQQVIFATSGLLLLYISSHIPYQTWFNLSYWLFCIGVLMLLATKFPVIGKKVNGAARWLRYPFTFQPSELFKIFWLFALCHYYGTQERTVNMNSFKSSLLVPILLFASCAAFGLLRQPDLGSFIFCMIIFGGIYIVAGASKLYVFGLVGASLIASSTAFIFWEHPRQRIQSYMSQLTDPTKMGYNLEQALISFSEGKVWGEGVGQSHQKKFFLPEAHTDFIFDIYGEEFGFIGVIFLISVYVILFLRGLKIARFADSLFGQLLAFGITLMIFAQALINMGMSIGLLPTKGLTLPLISYGGTSILVVCFSLGILINISKRNVTPPMWASTIYESSKWFNRFTQTVSNDSETNEMKKI